MKLLFFFFWPMAHVSIIQFLKLGAKITNYYIIVPGTG